MTINFNDTPEKKKFREENLPKVPITQSVLVPALNRLMNTVLVEALKMEIEVYKAFPKNNAKPDLTKFNPTNHKTCFMGLGFENDLRGADDLDLREYRRSIGTIQHPVWGACTLLEIWGADHFVPYPEMVTDVFKYCYGIKKKLPFLFFDSNPFIVTEKTGAVQHDEEDKERAREMYLQNYNLLRAQYKLKPVDEMSEEMEADFEKHWQTDNKKPQS